MVNMKFLTRKLITPADLNPRGTLHGGILLKWIDEEGAIHASCKLDTSLVVTKYISNIDFVSAVLPGDVVEIGMETIDIGKTSITLQCEVRNKNNNRVVCGIDKLTYVRVDKYGYPKEHGIVWKEE